MLTATAGWHPGSVARRARWFLLAFHVPIVGLAPTRVLSSIDWPAETVSGATVAVLLTVVLVSLALGGLQLRHSLAAARGGRPGAWQATLAGLALLSYIPLPWFGWDWLSTQFYVIGSALMLLPPRFAIAFVAATLVGVPTVAGVAAVVVFGEPLAYGLYAAFFWFVGLAVGGVGLYGATRLVNVLDELQGTRAELAEVEVARERLRVSRDLHDLLGQGLAAVALKGELAIRLQRTDAAVARAEIVGLTEVARDALSSLRSITYRAHAVSLGAEAEGAAALLRAADIDTHVELELGELPPRVDEVLGWIVREGATNTLRHADARMCSIVGTRAGGAVRLEIVNDGVPPAVEDPPDGRGLAGLEARARAVRGSLSATRTADGRFRLVAEVAAQDLRQGS